jgi:hypothetical protein
MPDLWSVVFPLVPFTRLIMVGGEGEQRGPEHDTRRYGVGAFGPGDPDA